MPNASNSQNLLSIAKAHLQDIADGKTGEALAHHYAADIEQTEYPNRLNPTGGKSDYRTLIERSERGKQIILQQAYDIQREHVSGNTVILEVIWRARLSIQLGSTPAGEEIKAFFALFFDFEGDKIIRQRNYDCFEPF